MKDMSSKKRENSSWVLAPKNKSENRMENELRVEVGEERWEAKSSSRRCESHERLILQLPRQP